MKPPTLRWTRPTRTTIPTRVRPWWANYAFYAGLAGAAVTVAAPALVFTAAGGDWATLGALGPAGALHYDPVLPALLTAAALLLVGMTENLASRGQTLDRLARSRGARRIPRRVIAKAGPLVERMVLLHSPIGAQDIHARVWLACPAGDVRPDRVVVRAVLDGAGWLTSDDDGMYLHRHTRLIRDSLGACQWVTAEQVWRLCGGWFAPFDAQTVRDVLEVAQWASRDGDRFALNEPTTVQ